VIITTCVVKSIWLYLTLFYRYIDFNNRKVICFDMMNKKQIKNDMETKEQKPWNDQNAPVSKNGVKWTAVIIIGATLVLTILTVVYAIGNI